MGKFHLALYEELKLYIQQHVWLNVGVEVKSLASGAKDKLSRLRKARDERKEPDYEPPMPPCDAMFMVAYLFDAGPTLVVPGMGEAPLDEQALGWYQRNRGFGLEPWQVRMLKHLSAEYLSMSQRAKEEACPPPWQNRLEDAERPSIAKRIRSLFR